MLDDGVGAGAEGLSFTIGRQPLAAQKVACPVHLLTTKTKYAPPAGVVVYRPPRAKPPITMPTLKINAAFTMFDMHTPEMLGTSDG